MAGLQSIVNACNGLTIDRRKMVGIQFTRNEIPRVSQTPTRNPWKFTLDMPSKRLLIRTTMMRHMVETTIRGLNPQLELLDVIKVLIKNPCFL